MHIAMALFPYRRLNKRLHFVVSSVLIRVVFDPEFFIVVPLLKCIVVQYAYEFITGTLIWCLRWNIF